MDIATIIGMVVGMAVILGAIMLGSSVGVFFNVPGIMVVVGGTAAAIFVKFPLKEVFSAFLLGAKAAFKNPKSDPEYLVNKAIEAAQHVRKSGLIALQAVQVDNELFQRGLTMCADGHSLEVVRDSLSKEMHLAIRKQEKGETMFRSIGDFAPAFGMIGTLVGLVQMLSDMSDPNAIGPAMAVAMLTTFYGALIANLFALPVADKLAAKTEADRVNMDLILDSVTQIHGNQNPTVLAEMLSVYLPGGKRASAED